MNALYLESLTLINDVKFTRREIDILAFFVSGRSAKKAASFFSIAPKTIENHTHNIMLKLGCNSRETIIDFIEKSDRLPALRKFYTALLAQRKFEDALKDMIPKIQNQKISCDIFFWKEDNRQTFLLHHLIVSLKKIGIQIFLKNYTDSWFFQAHDKKNVVLYNPPSNWENCVQKNHESPLFSENEKGIFLFSSRGEKPKEIFKGTNEENISDLNIQKECYFLVLIVLKELFPTLNLEKTISEFEKQYDILEGLIDFKENSFSLDNQKSQNKKSIFQILLKFRSHSKKGFLIFFLLLISLSISKIVNLNTQKWMPHLGEGLSLFHTKKTEEHLIRSDFIIPYESLLLARSELMDKINTGFKQNPNKIKTIALIGIGGSGKTTLAHRYATLQTSPIVGEINAGTKESLNISFENLAQALSKTPEDQKILEIILKIKLSLQRENQILQFVQKKFKMTPNWFLIYDNVESFNTLQKHFPTNPTQWGEGKILLTTRNANIENNIHIHTIIPVGELTDSEKLSLFIKVISNGNDHSFPSSQKEETQKFLLEIPSFPLDILVAAYYLKATNVSYKDYLENMFKYNQDFSNVQEIILEEAGDYTKTRYGIITLSLKYLIDSNEDFKDLFLFISLLDSQNIPRDLLIKYKNSAVVDNFIYHLKKHSLITSNPLSSLPLESVFSIHRSTQAVILSYLTKTLELKKNQNLVLPLSKTLEIHMSDAMDKEDFVKMKTLYRHAEHFLSHQNILSDETKAALSCELGCFYSYLRNSSKAEQLLTEGISLLNSHLEKNNLKIAHYMVYLGNVYRDLGNYEKAKDLFEKSLTLFDQKNSQDYSGMARSSKYLGVVYRALGNFKKAQFFLEQSLSRYEEIKGNPIGLASSLAHLGNLYKSLGDYDKAKEFLEKSLLMYKRYSETHVGAAWVCGDLGHIYIKLGNFKKAKELIDESLMICKKHFFEDHVYVAKSLVHLGIFYRETKDYDLSKSLFKKALRSFEKNYGKNHVETSFALQNLGEVYLLENNLKVAESIFKRALSISHKNKYPDEYIILESLAEVYQRKSKKKTSEYLIEQERLYLEKALTIIASNFPENSPHRARIMKKRKALFSQKI
ncbi:MAG TPA: tetratricopeptide repeat protein [Alphaproteobacteria bacterium]|nr:tetratricopeptide repeat protein [Alphaproteobacteria bacterium]HQS94142.1 tetratricopeptide repeat protein [Alphaproteobacteria bacterium]